jgi:hypothetical protein
MMDLEMLRIDNGIQDPDLACQHPGEWQNKKKNGR